MSTLPLVSVIIPCRSSRRFIEDALCSILEQDYPHFEVIVVENGSQDGTEECLSQFPSVKYLFLEEGNIAKARNRGVELAHGDFIAFLDADDRWEKRKTALQVEFLQKNSSYQGVVGKQNIYLDEGCPKPHWLKREFLGKPLDGYLPSALLVRREAFLPFDEKMQLADDIKWFFQAKHRGLLIHMLGDIIVHRRMHRSNVSNFVSKLQSELLSTIKESLDERRNSTC